MFLVNCIQRSDFFNVHLHQFERILQKAFIENIEIRIMNALIFILCHFSDFFSNVTYVNRTSVNSHLVLGAGNFSVMHCWFENMVSNGMGMIYNVNAVVGFMVVEYSSFYSCTSLNPGCGIRYQNEYGGCVISHVCANKMKIGKSNIDAGGIFSYTLGYTLAKNDINLTTVSYCSETKEQMESISMGKGKKIVISFNSSKNIANSYSGFYGCTDPNEVIYCTFINNSAISVVIGFRYTTGNNYLKYSNVVANSIDDYGIMYCGGAVSYISDCYIASNIKQLFSVVTSGQIYATNNFISHSYTFGIGIGTYKSFTGSTCLTHFKTFYCMNNQVPLQTPKMTLPRTYSEVCIQVILSHSREEKVFIPVFINVIISL